MDAKEKMALLRAQIEKEKAENDYTNNSGPTEQSLVYPHWKVDKGSTSTIRLLPDGNEDNIYPWLETSYINLKFEGIKGNPSADAFTLRIPCVETWKDSCPIMGYIRKNKWFDDPATKELGHQYWKKRTYIAQGFVVEDGIPEDPATVPENPIRRFSIGRQIFEIMESSMQDPELLEYLPQDFDLGTDFVVKKKDVGGQSNYTTSLFKRNPRPLTDEERAAIDKYGLPDLDTYRMKRPTADETNDLFEMFLASVEGELYDPERWSHLPWRPRGVEKASGGNHTPKAANTQVENAPEPTPVEESPVEETSNDDDPRQRAKDILSRIGK